MVLKCIVVGRQLHIAVLRLLGLIACDGGATAIRADVRGKGGHEVGEPAVTLFDFERLSARVSTRCTAFVLDHGTNGAQQRAVSSESLQIVMSESLQTAILVFH